ncbi:hypothetical protein M3629_03960 [Paenibacillus polysaccharolyticus]|uniref:hypothetical protein n=1 Tax=Paenibacillus polysaccharolyticus TaxID=582692 RepID=UPI00203FA445|nr:hypothetical protein [Paenibacillus polysaccharolyticus]MCM3131923.1 hypothetical protein [Paenibacillus polysaccharolyticus]
MFYVMENKTDVIVCDDYSSVSHNEQYGFKLVGTRKTESGAHKLANKRCEITA